jgi:hypothetical protein
MVKNTVLIFLLTATQYLTLAAPNPTATLVEGDLVELSRDETLYFDSTPQRKGVKGATYVVAMHRPEMHRLWVYSKDKNGNAIAFNFPEDAGLPFQGSAARQKKIASLIQENRFLEAHQLTERLAGMPESPVPVGQLHTALKNMLSALAEQERLTKGRPVVENRISECNKKSRQILGPKPLDTNISPRDIERAESLRKEAINLQQEFDVLWRKMEVSVQAARQSVDLLLEQEQAQPLVATKSPISDSPREPEPSKPSVAAKSLLSEMPSSNKIFFGGSVFLFLLSLFLFIGSRRKS